MQGKNNIYLKSIFYVLVSILIAVCVIWNISCAHYAVNTLNMNDFGKFYYSAINYFQGRDMYGPNPATEIPLRDYENKQFWNMNPPHFHVLVFPFLWMAPGAAFYGWMIAGSLCLLLSLFMILDEIEFRMTPRKFCYGLLALSAFSGTSTMMITGQISWFVLPLVTCAWRFARRDKWLHSAIFLGICIALKVFFLIFVPYLVLRRKFLASFLALLVTAALFAAGIVVFGVSTYASWVDAISSMDWPWASMNASALGFFNRILVPTTEYTPLVAAKELIYPLWVWTVAILLLTTMTVVASDRSPNACDRGFALILTTMLLVSPLGWVYYSWVLLGPMVCLVDQWYRETTEPVRPPLIYIRWLFFSLAMVGGFMQLPMMYMFQPIPFATFSIGSSYFWSFLLLWIALMADYILRLRREPALTAPERA